MQVGVVVLLLLDTIGGAGLGFCTPSWTDQRQLGLFSGLRLWACGFQDPAAVEVFRRFRGSGV